MSAEDDRDAAGPVPTAGDEHPGGYDDHPEAHGSHLAEGLSEGLAEDLAEGEPDSYVRFDCTDDATPLSEAVAAAEQAVGRGECVVLPTDTVYGIGADAFSPDAVQRLLDAKSRGRDMPPPVLIADAALIQVLAVEVPQEARDLVAKHWPGPLTVICRAQPSLRMDLGEADGTIALRVPDHELAREVLRRTGPLAVSSANLSGQPAAVTCDEAVEQLGDRVAVYLDGGRLGTGDPTPSTMVDFTQTDAGQVLRRGALSTELLRQTLPDLEDLASPPVPAPDAPQDDPSGTDPAEPSGTDPAEPTTPEPVPDAQDAEDSAPQARRGSRAAGTLDDDDLPAPRPRRAQPET